METILLLRLEWEKFKDNAVVYLFGLMFLLTFPTTLFIGKEIKNLPPPLPSNAILFNFPTVWDYLGYTGNWLVFFFLGFIVMYMITSEVGFKTMRQNIISGYTRKDYFKAKLLVVLSLSIGATLLYTIIALTIGFFHNEPFSFDYAFENNYAVPRFFIMCMGYMSFALMIAFIIRRSGIAIFTYISYIFFIEPVLKWWLHFGYIVKNESINYWPLNAIEDLMPLPIFRFMEGIPRDDLDFPFLLSTNQAIITSSIYTIIFLSIAYYNFIKRDM